MNSFDHLQTTDLCPSSISSSASWFIFFVLLIECFCLPSSSNAGFCFNKNEIVGDNVSYRICGVPDLDQQREPNYLVDGLPNGGRNYCVPTSTMNWLAHIANHGWPSLAPGPGSWGPEPVLEPNQYNFMTTNILKDI